jgi:very-short-patch-repair endonuclease
MDDELAHRRAHELAAKQLDLIRYDEAIDCGLTRHAIRNLVISRRWTRVLPAVFSTTTGEVSADRRRAAAVLSVRQLHDQTAPPAALYGVSALEQWGVKVDHPSTAIVRVVVPHDHQPASPAGVRVVRSRRFDEDDVVWRCGVPVTRLERALADATRQLKRYEPFVAVLADAVQSGRTTVERVALEADLRPTQAGSGILTRALRAVDRGDRSIAEAALADLIEAAGVPTPSRLTVLQTSIGPVIPDFLWADLGLYAEVDGAEWHLTPEDWEHDLERQNALTALGLTPLRYPAAAVLGHGDRVVASIRAEVLRRVALAQSPPAVG